VTNLNEDTFHQLHNLIRFLKINHTFYTSTHTCFIKKLDLKNSELNKMHVIIIVWIYFIELSKVFLNIYSKIFCLLACHKKILIATFSCLLYEIIIILYNNKGLKIFEKRPQYTTVGKKQRRRTDAHQWARGRRGWRRRQTSYTASWPLVTGRTSPPTPSVL